MSPEISPSKEIGYVIIRVCKPKDVNELTRLLWESWPDYYIGNRASGNYLVAENEGQIVGTIFSHKSYGKKHFANLVVKKELRKQGIATALFQAAEEQAQSEGITSVDFYAEDGLIPFYENLGYTRVSKTGTKMAKTI